MPGLSIDVEDPVTVSLWGVAPPPSIKADGTCSLSIAADRARVVVSTTARSLDPATAVGRAGEQAGTIRQKVEELGLADLELETGRPVTTPDLGVFNAAVDFAKTYDATIETRVVTSDLERLGVAIESILLTRLAKLVEAGPYVSESRLLAAEGDCLAIALGNARARAQRMADALRVDLGMPLGVVDQRSGDGGPGSSTWVNSAAAGELLGGKHLDVRLSLSVAFRIHER